MIIPDSGLGDFTHALHSAVIHAKVFDRNLKIVHLNASKKDEEMTSRLAQLLQEPPIIVDAE